MKTYLTEAESANSVEKTCIGFRRPFKLLQDFPFFRNSNMSSKVSASSPLKTTSRQKKVESAPQKEFQSKARLTSLTSRQTAAARNSANLRSSCRSPVSYKKQEQSDGKSKTSESSDGSVTSVGSLTSSPKWSHIKNKFENGDSTLNSKSSKSTVLSNETKKSFQPSKISRNTQSSNLENNSFLHKNKYLSARKEIDKKNDTSVNRSENILSSNKTAEKAKFGSCNSRIETHKLKTRCASPKNSHLNIPAANTSALHSSNTSKRVSSNISSVLRKPQSSNSGSPEGSVKSSRCSSPNTASSSPTPKSCSPKTSLSNIPIDRSVNNSLKTSSDSSNDCSNNVARNIQSTMNSNLSSSYLSKRNLPDSKMYSSYSGKQRHEDKPILSFNLISQQSDTPETVESKTVRKPLGSDPEKTSINTISSVSSKVTKTAPNSASSTTSNETNILENAEKIKNLTKQSQVGQKAVWVKDNAGNWIKKADTQTKAICSSKVASLRSKFMETSKECSTPLTKSSTTSSVPSKQIQNNRPLAKSSTTSNICDKIFLDDLSKKVTTVKDVVEKKVARTNSEVSKNSLSSNEYESQDSSLQLNIVQRAILSYEGNLALLSPETQRRLKLVSEKVQAQTDDDKILRAKVKSYPQNNPKSCPDRNSDVAVKLSNNLPKKSNSQNSTGEPALPVRNFLNRYQKSKGSASKEQNKTSNDDNKPKSVTKTDSRASCFTDISSATLNKNETKDSLPNDSNAVFKKTDSSASSGKSVTKLTMNFKLPSGQTDVKSRNQENSCILQPNSSFLWRHSERAPSEYSKGSTTSSVSLTSSDYRNYYDIENYYSSLELEIDKGSENSEEHIYIDSQESNTSSDNYATSTYSAYQNIPKGKIQNGSHDDWTDMSDDDFRKNSDSSNQSSTLKKRRNKRHSSYRESSPSFTKSQNDQRKQIMNDTISFTDSSDTLINNEVGNESACDLSDVNHLYEPVYESLGNYLRTEDDENCSSFLSPDEPENEDFMHCSLTSLESAESAHQDKDENSRISKTMEEKNSENKKGGNKISQLKRHLSWTKNDIRLELSSKFNKIKIKKNGRNSTEIGLKMQDSENINTSPKKKTFIKCILRQKSASSIPLKRSPSPKKESALFYVHLTMGREKQRPCSDSAVAVEASKYSGDKSQNIRKQSDSALTLTTAVKCNQQVPRSRKFASGHTIQRPKTPPPLPPVQAVVNNKTPPNSGSLEKQRKTSTTTLICESDNLDSEFYTILDPEYISSVDPKQLRPYENEVLRLIHTDGKSRSSNSTSVELPLDESDVPSDRSSKSNSMKFSNDLNLPLLQGFQTEHLKSPFEEEPMYQFYQKDVQQRATLWYSIDGSESEFEDDISSKLSETDYQSPKCRVLQSQLSAMDLVHGDGGQRRLWCEVPEVVNSGILKTIISNDRKIQEAMFEVITSEASYLKSLNFLTEHFVQCTEFSGDYTEKHVLDKRERHILFSDIQPVRDVSASLLSDLEKRWLKNILLSDICDILYHHASRYFSVYVKYCSNQLYQERLLRELKEKRPEFVAVLKRLESNVVCQGLDMHSFLMLPMQRITRLPLLIDAIFKRLSVDSPIYQSCKIALATVNKIVAECNEGACKMQRMEEMLVISQQIDFKACKGLGLLSASRWLVKKGELVQLLMDNANRRAFSRSSRWCKIQLYLFLFTDLLVVTKKESDDSYSVVDYCPRNMLQVMTPDKTTPPLRLPSSYKNIFQLIMLNNRDGKTVEMLLSCLLESDRTRWMSAVTPAKSENPDEKIYEEWDCPQVQCTHAYNAEQPDELSLEEADVVNVFKKMSDGWFEGERIRDGVRGWFPSSHTVEIINSHVRARNLHQRYRLLMLSQTYLEEQYKVQAQQGRK